MGRVGADKNPYNCQMMINYFDIKRVFHNKSNFHIDFLTQDGVIESFKDAYYYMFFHGLGHVVAFYNNFDRYLKFVDDQLNDIYEDGSDQIRAYSLAGKLFREWKSLSKQKGLFLVESNEFIKG
ncbi:hypothetical protein MWH25_02415 [Natroniella acetigena]|uniref:hypothetical protein n=1 Tax=Natroniella acetigena TaxID=52004 RepID=UPI00200B0CCD|nr:hypothetical protein [Natroniella acetigena]MCK8826603.1 hypothetical protein [Natroniella acetigena]